MPHFATRSLTRPPLLTALLPAVLLFACEQGPAQGPPGTNTKSAAQSPAADAAPAAPTLGTAHKSKNYVARVGNGGITTAAYVDKLREKARVARKGPLQLTEEERQDVLDKMIEEEMLFQHGVTSGVAAEDAFTRRRIVNLVLEQEGKTRGGGEQEIPDDELRAYYEANREEYKTEEMVRASHILLKLGRGATEAQRREKVKKLRAVRRQAVKNPNKFGELAKQHSEGPSAGRGGDLGFFTRDRMVRPFAEAAFKLPVGEISNIVETTFGYHVIKIEARTPARYEPFEQARRKVMAHLSKLKRDEAAKNFVKELRGKVKVTVHKDKLSKAFEPSAPQAAPKPNRPPAEPPGPVRAPKKDAPKDAPKKDAPKKDAPKKDAKTP